MIIKLPVTPSYSAQVAIGDIQITDYTGEYIIRQSPQSVYYSPMSSLFKTNGITTAAGYQGTTSGYLTLYINLDNAYQGWWLPNTNSYNLEISYINTGTNNGNEVFYNVGTQFNVTAPISTMDLAAAIGEGQFTWSASGATWSQNEIAWFEGGDQWNEHYIDNNPPSGPISLALADIAGDGRNDVVVASQSQSESNVYWYQNEAADGAEWSSARTICAPFDALPGTQDAGGTSLTNVNEDSTLWSQQEGSFVTSYDGQTYVCTDELASAMVTGDLNNDGLQDIVVSFVHVIIYTNAMSDSSADPSNTWGMYFNRGIDVFWNDGNWTMTSLYNTTSWISSNTADMNSNAAATSLAIGDLSENGYNDIVAGYENGVTDVWMNQWGSVSGNLWEHEENAFGTSASFRQLPKVPGTEPWSHVEFAPKLEVADMNGDGYPDIVRTSTSNDAVYIIYTVSTGSGTTTNVAFKGFPMNSTESAVVSGANGNLATNDSSYQKLTEVPLISSTLNVVAGAKLDSSNQSIGQPNDERWCVL